MLFYIYTHGLGSCDTQLQSVFMPVIIADSFYPQHRHHHDRPAEMCYVCLALQTVSEVGALVVVWPASVLFPLVCYSLCLGLCGFHRCVMCSFSVPRSEK